MDRRRRHRTPGGLTVGSGSVHRDGRLAEEQLAAAATAMGRLLDVLSPIHPADREAIFRRASTPWNHTPGARRPTGADMSAVVRALMAAADAAEASSSNVFRRDGQVWTLTFRGRTVRLPDGKGLRNLHCLLSHPGTDIHVANLLDLQNAGAARPSCPPRLHHNAERARKAVYERIRDTIRRLDGRHPELAQHLRMTVTTGTCCRYDAKRSVTWTLG
jgi:hypothetical protein